MSIKRSKGRSSGRRDTEDSSTPAWARAPASESLADKSWAEQVEGKPDDAFAPYSLKTRFQTGNLIQHPKFGKGVVILVVDKRIEVLFNDGKKQLSHAG